MNHDDKPAASKEPHQRTTWGEIALFAVMAAVLTYQWWPA